MGYNILIPISKQAAHRQLLEHIMPGWALGPANVDFSSGSDKNQA